MSDRRVISANQLPIRVPVFQTMTLWLFLDRLQPSLLVWGVVGTLWCIAMIGALVLVFTQKPTAINLDR